MGSDPQGLTHLPCCPRERRDMRAPRRSGRGLHATCILEGYPMATAATGRREAAHSSFFSATLGESDPEIAGAIGRELGRQQNEIELIASENIVSRAVLEAAGSVLTNKYA